MEMISFRNFFAQMSDLEIDFLIFHLNRYEVFGHQIYRSNLGEIDAKFIQYFVRNIEVGILGTAVADGIAQKMNL
jgi:hypothetical protein